jgi:TolA-binding protein
MTETVIVAVLGFLGTAVGSFSGMKLMSYRIEQLEKKVDKHNNFAERVPILEEQMKVANHRIDDLEKHEEKIQEDLTENLKSKG